MPVNLLNGQNNAESTNLFVGQNGKQVKFKQLSSRQKKLWHDYKLVQYDVTAGHHYLIRGGQLK